ncbi:MAG: hypothetical protein HN691_18240 [Bacteroidetes bacterium]|jgi:hypothetical protein|nr:hypothetical protein [Bacteroidota bacterium]MBT7996816.1 hypothetical protein [Bacteroidota bacterium]
MTSFSIKFTKKQCQDSGLVLSLLLLIIGIIKENTFYFEATLPIVIITMVVPILIYPFSILWMNFAVILGFISPKIILSVVFFIIVFPTALVRRLLGKDSLKLKEFKKSTESIFIDRDKTFIANDLETPY